MLSITTVSIFLFPYIQQAEALTAIIFIGSAIGSLIPDVDAPDATIFHENVRGLDSKIGKAINDFIGPFLPIFGYITKYMIYKPAVFLFDHLFKKYSFRDRHRAFSHSIFGVFFMTAVTGVYMVPVLLWLKLFLPLYLAAFLAAYAIGAFLHMLEDSCTKSGIAWNSPFSQKKLRGRLVTGKDNWQPAFFLYFLVLISFAVIYVDNSSQYVMSDPVLTGCSFLAVTFSWLFFTKGIARVKLD